MTAIDHCPKCGALLVAGKCITCMEERRILAMSEDPPRIKVLRIFKSDRGIWRIEFERR